MSLNSSLMESLQFGEILPQGNAFWHVPVSAGSPRWARYAQRASKRGPLLAFSCSDSQDPWSVCVSVPRGGGCDFTEGSKPIKPFRLLGTPPPALRSRHLHVLSKLNHIPRPFIV